MTKIIIDREKLIAFIEEYFRPVKRWGDSAIMDLHEPYTAIMVVDPDIPLDQSEKAVYGKIEYTLVKDEKCDHDFSEGNQCGKCGRAQDV